MFDWLKRKANPAPEEPSATNAQIGYMISLMDELDVDTLDVVVDDPRTGDRVQRAVGKSELHLLRKGDASQIISQLKHARDNR